MAVDDANLSPSSRRVFLLTGAAALSHLKAFPTTPGCTLTPEQEQGPYYVSMGCDNNHLTISRLER